MRHRRSLPLLPLVAVGLVLAASVPVAHAQEVEGQSRGVGEPKPLSSIDSANRRQLQVFQVPFEYEGYIQGAFPEPMLIHVEEGPFWVQVQPGSAGAVFVVPPGEKPQRVEPVDARRSRFPDGYVSVESGWAIVLTGQADCFL